VDTLSYKTISANKATVQKEWVVVDATDLVLGRMGSKVAKLFARKIQNQVLLLMWIVETM
jgi:LSU ribosomal protein L13P